MKLTADNKGRIACRKLFPPHASFEAIREPDGKVTLVRLRREEHEPRIVKPVLRKGLLVLPVEGGELDAEALDREIREERDWMHARAAKLAGADLVLTRDEPLSRLCAAEGLTTEWP